VWSPSKAAALRAAKRRPSIYPAIDLMPFHGVSLVLLIMFMCYPGAFHGDSPVDLPKARSATLQSGAVREDAIRIAVTRDGSRFFGSNKAEPGELSDLIRTATRAGSERKVYLLADCRAKDEDVEIVFDQIRLAGITNVVILADKPYAP
jgi:biopolymer transport protein TolR